jgi:hypothetical protein
VPFHPAPLTVQSRRSSWPGLWPIDRPAEPDPSLATKVLVARFGAIPPRVEHAYLDFC